MRPLTLHVSALTETEYESYTKFLKDICDAEEVEPRKYEDGTYYERVRVSARDARAWMRRRYARVGAASIDTILHFFAPDMRAGDTLSGGQHLAALRVVVHADAGRDIHRGLAFIQASPVLDEHTASQGALQ
ncbi:hypothetical protein BDQ17DRAFT_308032 [Cyathus striatus]|nr:hypothetical protein BDQ17DRAFT_308032 [Cyathus striatus]